MGYLEDLERGKDRIREIVAKEKSVLSLDKVDRPSRVEEVLKFDFSKIDTLTPRELEQFMGMLSQQLVYATKYVNQLRIGVTHTKKFFNNVLDIESLKEDGKTGREREVKAKIRVVELRDIEDKLLEEETRLAVYDNTIEQLTQHLQTLKKVYDARIKETSAHTN